MEVEEREMERGKRRRRRWLLEEKQSITITTTTAPPPSPPSPDFAHLLLSNLLSSPNPNNNRNSKNESCQWKLLQAAMSSGLLHPLHVLSLLSSSLLPSRRFRPQSFFLFLELLSRFGLSLPPLPPHHHSSIPRIVKDIDAALGLSETYPEVDVKEMGQVMVLFLFTMLVGLIDSSFHDWGLRDNHSPQYPPIGLFPIRENVDMDADFDAKDGGSSAARNERLELLRKNNSFKAIEVLIKLTENRKALLLLRLVQFNM